MDNKCTQKELTTTAINLLILAQYIEDNVPEEKIYMDSFRTTAGTRVPFISKNECGTTGCIMGWAPHSPALEAIDEDFEPQGLSFDKYGKRLFPALYEKTDVDPYHYSRNWLETFGPNLPNVKKDLIQGLREMSSKVVCTVPKSTQLTYDAVELQINEQMTFSISSEDAKDAVELFNYIPETLSDNVTVVKITPPKEKEE